MRNNDLVKYITQLQSRMFGQRGSSEHPGVPQPITQPESHGAPAPVGSGVGATINSTSSPFAYIQSPVLYDPNMNVSYVATTTFSPAANEPRLSAASPPHAR